MPRDIGKKALQWVAEEVADYLHYQCVVDPNPPYVQALADVWTYVLGPFFAGSPAGNGGHGPSLDPFHPQSTVIAALGPNNNFSVQVTNVCSAIAYVLSTAQQPFPPSKHLVLAAVFTHLCRLAHVSQRPQTVHFLWPTIPGTSTTTNPIILLDDATVLEIQDDSDRPQYIVRTLDVLLNSMGVSTGVSQGYVSGKECPCSMLIPAIWSANDGGPVVGLSMNFDVLLSTLRQYRKGEVRSASLRFAARPTCGTCTAILISPSFHTASGSSGLGIAYTDLAKTENTVETASSSGHNHGHPHARTISSSSSSGSGSDQDYVRQPARSARNNRRRASTSATGYSTDGGSGRTVAFASPLTIGKTLSRSASVAPLSPTSPQTSSSNSTSNSDSTTSSHTQNYRSGSFTARRRSSSSAATNPTASYPYSSTLRFAPPEPTSYSGTRPAIIPGVKYPIQPPASPEIGISVGGKSGPPLPQVTEANPGGTARRRRRASTNLAPSSGMVVPPYTPATYNGPLPVPLPPAVPMGGFPYPYPYPAAAVGAVKLSPPTSSSSTSTATSRTSSSSAGMSGYMNLGIPGMPSMNPPPHYRHASDRGPTTNTGSNDNSQLRPPMPKHKRSASTPGLAVPAGNGNGSVSPASESATSSGASWSTSNSVNVLNNTANLNTATNTSRSSKRISSGYQQFNPPSAPVPSAAAAAAVMGDMGVAVVNPASGSYPYGMGIDHSYAYTGIMEHGKLASHPRSNNTSAHMGLGMGMGMGAASAMPLPLTWPTSGSASSGSSDGSNSPYAGNSSAQSSNPRMRRPTQSKVYSIDHANGLSIHNNGVAGGVGALAGGMQGMSISNN